MKKTIISYALFTVALSHLSFGSDTLCSCKCHPMKLPPKATRNLVLEPNYVQSSTHDQKKTECPPPSAEKVQYEPLTADSPVIKEREAPAERKNGAEYEKGTELHIAPAPDHTVKQEEIHEQQEPPPQEDKQSQPHLRRADYQ